MHIFFLLCSLLSIAPVISRSWMQCLDSTDLQYNVCPCFQYGQAVTEWQEESMDYESAYLCPCSSLRTTSRRLGRATEDVVHLS